MLKMYIIDIHCLCQLARMHTHTRQPVSMKQKFNGTMRYTHTHTPAHARTDTRYRYIEVCVFCAWDFAAVVLWVFVAVLVFCLFGWLIVVVLGEGWWW